MPRAMVTDSDGKFLPLVDLLAVHEKSSESEDNVSVRSGSKRDHEDDHMSSISIDSLSGEDIFERLEARAQSQTPVSPE